MITLSPQQAQILLHDPTAHARVLAGPGTGKSVTSIAYLKHVIEDNPELKVSYITFTRAAVSEFVETLGDDSSLMGENTPGTVHGFALGQLIRYQSASIPYPVRIPDSWEAKEIIRPQLSRRLRKRGFATATPGVVDELEKEMAAGFQALDPDLILTADRDPTKERLYR